MIRVSAGSLARQTKERREFCFVNKKNQKNKTSSVPTSMTRVICEAIFVRRRRRDSSFWHWTQYAMHIWRRHAGVSLYPSETPFCVVCVCGERGRVSERESVCVRTKKRDEISLERRRRSANAYLSVNHDAKNHVLIILRV